MKKKGSSAVKLTDKQRAFCIFYCKNGWNGTQAAISAGYSEYTAKEMAHENLTKHHIVEEINRLKGNLEELLNISKARVVTEHMKLAFSSVADMHDTWITRKEFDELTSEQRACIQEISTKTEKRLDAMENPVEVEYIKIKLYDKQKALDSISKMMGYDAPIKAELSGTLDITQITGIKVND